MIINDCSYQKNKTTFYKIKCGDIFKDMPNGHRTFMKVDNGRNNTYVCLNDGAVASISLERAETMSVWLFDGTLNIVPKELY